MVNTRPAPAHGCSPSLARCVRARVKATCWDLDIPVPDDLLTADDMLKMATLDGAYVAGVAPWIEHLVNAARNGIAREILSEACREFRELLTERELTRRVCAALFGGESAQQPARA